MITIGICDDEPKMQKALRVPLERKLQLLGKNTASRNMLPARHCLQDPRRMDWISSFWILRWMD